MLVEAHDAAAVTSREFIGKLLQVKRWYRYLRDNISSDLAILVI